MKQLPKADKIEAAGARPFGDGGLDKQLIALQEAVERLATLDAAFFGGEAAHVDGQFSEDI